MRILPEGTPRPLTIGVRQTGVLPACTSTNAEFRGWYLYTVDVAQAGQTVTVEVYDAPTYAGSTPNNFTGDNGTFATQFELFEPDGVAGSISTDPSLSLAGRCTAGPGRRPFPSNYQPSTYHNRWTTLCTFVAPTAGSYGLRITNTDISADPVTGVAACANCPGDGINGFSLRASAAGGPQPRVGMVTDASIWLVANGVTAKVPLVSAPSSRAGQTLVLDMFDPGDGANGTMTLAIKGPHGETRPCTVRASAAGADRGTTPTTTENYPIACSIVTRDGATNRFNNRWVRITLTIPANYTCVGPCTWDASYTASSSSPTDRVTWAASWSG